MSRTTLSELRGVLRGMVQAGTSDYTLGTATYWDDDQLDTILDNHRTDHVFELMADMPTTGTAGAYQYNDYRTGVKSLEKTTGGTAVFYVQDSTGAFAGTADYSVDYLRGVVTFAADTEGATYYFTGRSYDLNAAAGDIWRKKAGYYHTAFSFSTDNHKVDRESIYKHCIQMAETFENMSDASIMTVQTWRSDSDAL